MRTRSPVAVKTSTEGEGPDTIVIRTVDRVDSVGKSREKQVGDLGTVGENKLKIDFVGTS